ncbi:MAG: S41 family peptidase, partial [Anaerolineae bacterium]
RDAARILKWDDVLGSLEAGKRADLMVVNGRRGDPYSRLLEARESSISLVVVEGVPRCGQERLMSPFGGETEAWDVGGARRLLNLSDAAADPLVQGLSLGAARDLLRQGLQDLTELARPLDEGTAPVAVLARLGRSFDDEGQALAALASMGLAGGNGQLPGGGPIAFLELEQDELLGESLRPHLPHPETGQPTAMAAPIDVWGASYAQLLEDVTIELDPLTIVDDGAYFRRLAVQPNLPDWIKSGLPPFYGVDPLPEDADFIERLHPAVQPQFASSLDLATFMHTGGLLSLSDRQQIVKQALVLLERAYVHLPLKRAMHATDPIQRLKLLQYQLEQQSSDELSAEIDFHNEMTAIFTSVRDLHTNYLLPRPFRDKTAFLPFMIEEYFYDGAPRYIVSKIVGDAGPEMFLPGVEVLYWNGIPIRRAVALNAERQAGGNPDARHAQALNSMTIRPLVRMLPPDEEWVTLRYRAADGEEHEMTQQWLIFSPQAAAGAVSPDELRAEVALLGLDLQTDVIQGVKKILYAPAAVAAEQRIEATLETRAAPPEGMDTTMPSVFRARQVETEHGTFGYIRIFTFNVSEADAFVGEFARLAALLPEEGLIVDVRGNGGGLIYAAERLLQVFTPRRIDPQRAQFINSPLTLALCRRHAPSKLLANFDLEPWILSIAQAVQTGATYSQAFPITSPESCNSLGQRYGGPVLLITDGLCYSATDIFVAGFQDHDIGPILGTSGNTGAGGANVWTHYLLQRLMHEPGKPYLSDPESPFRPLPHGADMRVAVRRTLRVGERAGIPLEDLGVVPDAYHLMTRRDLMEGNVDLLEEAGRILARKPVYRLSVEIESLKRTTLKAKVYTQNLSRLDIFLGGRPQGSLNVGDGHRQLVLDVPSVSEAGDVLHLELKGYADGKLAAGRRVRIPRLADDPEG